MSSLIKIPQRAFNSCYNYIRTGDIEQRARLLVPMGVAGIWGLQTGMEVKNAVKEDKKNAFISNAIIGTAMILGGLIGHRGFQRYLDKEATVTTARNLAEKHLIGRIPEKIGNFVRKFPTKEFLHALSIPVSAGILGGVAGEFAQRKFPVKFNKPEEITKKASTFIDYKYGLMDQIGDLPGSDYMDTVHPSFSTIVGYSVGKQKGIKNKIKEFVFEIISGVLVPVSIVTPAAYYLKKHIPEQRYKNIIGITTFGMGLAASFAGKTFASWFNKKVTDRVIEHQFWQDVTAKQRQLMKSYMFTDNPDKKQQIQEQVKELKDLSEKVKNSEVSIRKIASKVKPDGVKEDISIPKAQHVKPGS